MKYIITSAQKGAKLNKNFWSNIQRFKKEMNVDKILVFVMNGRYKHDEVLHPSVATLPDIELINDYQQLHSKVFAYDSKVLAQRVKPLLGLSDKLPMERSYILPATKRRLESIASLGTKPRFFCSTGALTQPFYKLNTSQGVKAFEEHQLGFVYFDSLDNKKKMDFMSVPVDKTGNFFYETNHYHSGKIIRNIPAECLILGDWHLGQTNKYARIESIRQIEEFKPKYVVFHDIFDGYSINHHNRKKLLERLRDVRNKRNSLKKELEILKKEIEFFAKKFPDVQFLVAESNHDEFIKHFINDKHFFKDEINFEFAASLVSDLIDPEAIPLKVALDKIGELPKNFKFFSVTDSFRIRGWDVVQHGHNGSNGARGSRNTFKRLNLKAIFGHTHQIGIGSNWINVGTNTNLNQSYTRGGLSGWMHANAIIYQNKTATLKSFVARQPSKIKY
jgi:hypothetical protein